MVPLLARQVVQQAYVVDDIEAAMGRWTDTLGVGPWFYNPDIQVTDTRYRGAPTALRFAGAITYAGDTQLELIQQLDDSPSCYRDLYPRGREGHHHVAIFADDFDADVARYVAAGFPVAFSGANRDMRFAYCDTSSVLGIMVEILEDVPSVRASFGAVRAAAASWDGTDPIRGRAVPPTP